MLTFNQLPPEIITAIFEHGVWSDPSIGLNFPPLSNVSESLEHDTSKRPLLYDPELRICIGRVCKLWKSTRDSSPRLWTRLDIVYAAERHPISSLEWLVRRTGSKLPLDIRLCCASSAADEDEDSQTLQISRAQALLQILAVICPLTPRWHKFHLTALTRAEAYTSLIQFAQYPAPILEELSISAPTTGRSIHSLTHDNPTHMIPIFHGQTPSLRNLYLGPIALNIDISLLMATGLRSIRLAGGRIPLPRLMTVLRANPNLETLTTIMVTFIGASWPPPKSSPPTHDDRLFVTLPHLTSLTIHAARPSMAAFLYYVKMPLLSSLTLCRTEDDDELDIDMFALAGILPNNITMHGDDAPNEPNTAAILQILSERVADSQLRTFALTYGSVWETNPIAGERGTDRALMSFLRACGAGITDLAVHNYSHVPSTLLEALSTRSPPNEAAEVHAEGAGWLCSRLDCLHISNCEGAQRGAIRSFVEARVQAAKSTPLVTAQATTFPVISEAAVAPLKALIVEANSTDSYSIQLATSSSSSRSASNKSRLACGSDDIRWIRKHVDFFHINQGGAVSWDSEAAAARHGGFMRGRGGSRNGFETSDGEGEEDEDDTNVLHPLFSRERDEEPQEEVGEGVDRDADRTYADWAAAYPDANERFFAQEG